MVNLSPKTMRRDIRETFFSNDGKIFTYRKYLIIIGITSRGTVVHQLLRYVNKISRNRYSYS